MKNKGFTFIELALLIGIIGILCAVLLSNKTHACGWFDDCNAQDNTTVSATDQLLQNQVKLQTAEPIPAMTDSLERKNIAARAVLFNDANKESYIYLISYGKVMAFYTVKGKVSSLNSYMTPQEQIVYGDGTRCQSGYTSNSNCYTIQAPDVDGSYGDNPDGIFFFTTDGAYVEWKGDYMMSDQPLQLSTAPELIRSVK